MSPTCPCASAWPMGSPCLQHQQGVFRVLAGSGSLAGGPRGRCRHTSYKTSWGCRRVSVPEPPVGWTLAVAAAAGNQMGWLAPWVVRWVRTWCLCSGWCWWIGWSPEVGDLHRCNRWAGHHVFSTKNKRNMKKIGGKKKNLGICKCVIQCDNTEHCGCCFYVGASGECAFVCKCVTHTKELRAAWPSWCCCHADMEPSESPGELKPCREEISALLSGYSVKTNAAAHTLRTNSRLAFNTGSCWTNKHVLQNSPGWGSWFLSWGMEVWGGSRARLTSRIVGGGHAWVDQALWG